MARTSTNNNARRIEDSSVRVRGDVRVTRARARISRAENQVKPRRHGARWRVTSLELRARSLESRTGREYVGFVIVIGLVTLALVGVVQSVGALVEPLPIETGWCDGADEAKRGQTTGQIPSTPVAIVPARPCVPHRNDSELDGLDLTTRLISGIRLGPPESRAPPALLSRSLV